MTLPITQDDLQKFETIITEKKNKPMSDEMREHLKVVTRLINDAYFEGYKKGVSEVVNNG